MTAMQISTPLNHLFPDTCPGCGGEDRCIPDACVCPTCGGQDAAALEVWRELAPVMRVLNSEGWHWGWGSDRDRHFIDCNDLAEVTLVNGQYLVSGYERLHRATQLDQEQGAWIDLYLGTDTETAAYTAHEWAESSR